VRTEVAWVGKWTDAAFKALLLLIMVAITSCRRPVAPPPQGPVPVETVTVTRARVPLYGEWVAVLDGYVNAQIQPEVSGYLIRQDYPEGGVVTKGQVLFEIDPRPFEAQLDQAKSTLAQAQAQLQLQRINVNRDMPLAQVHAVSQSQLDNEVKQQQAAEASVAASQAQIRQAELNLGFTKVRSLVSGIAGQATLQVGALVSPTSVLTTVSQVNPIKVYFSIGEQEYLDLSSRAHAEGHKDLLSSGSTIPLELTLANGEKYPYPGHIVFVDRSVTAETGSIRIAASFPNSANLLRPGQFGRIKAETEMRKDALVIPQRALSEVQGNYQVAVVQTGNVVKLAPVKPGPQIGSDIVIESGLEVGQQIVTEGVGKLREGTPVNPEPAKAARASATEMARSH
jgi:membrane fusion protein, multidrug efflux system